MRCDGCQREVIASWEVDGTAARLCCRCIAKALTDAETKLIAERMRRLFRRTG